MRPLIGLLAMLLCLAGCASGGPAYNPEFTDNVALPPPDSTTATGAYEGGSDYRIGAQDLLEVSVFGIEELSRSVRVNSNGQVSLPLIGGVMAGGKTIPELERAIGEKLENGYLQDPQVSVFVKEFTSQQVTLEGALKKPGIYPLTGKTTLIQAISMAQGLDELADLSGVLVFRTIDGKRMGAVYDLAQVRAGNAPDPQIYGDDVIVVEKSGSRSAFREFIRSIPAIGIFTLL
ncbi:MAG: polysaccharide export protein [Pseudomonadota bacterium]|nr:polysaccharide export protein [Pseudomonadota bacterium]